MSTAQLVPETWNLSGDDAFETLRVTGRRRLLKDAFMRMRVSDGFSHARSMAFMTALVLVQAVIALVGFASAVGNNHMSDAIVSTIKGAVPGPAGNLLTSAVDQARSAGVTHRYLALILGLVGTLVTATTLMGQFERGLNRMYGVEQDRPTLEKYGRAFLFAITAGSLSTVAFVTLAFGRSVGDELGNHTMSTIWDIVRWPLGLGVTAAAVTLLFRWSPRRRQPALSWLAYGATISVGLSVVVTLGLGLFFSLSTSFGETYGPLAGMVALLLWSLLSAMAILFGAAVAAQLEAVRAGRGRPQDEEKVENSEPDAEAAPSTDESSLEAAAGRR
jgi:YihY family inner membrane protein